MCTRCLSTLILVLTRETSARRASNVTWHCSFMFIANVNWQTKTMLQLEHSWHSWTYLWLGALGLEACLQHAASTEPSSLARAKRCWGALMQSLDPESTSCRIQRRIGHWPPIGVYFSQCPVLCHLKRRDCNLPFWSFHQTSITGWKTKVQQRGVAATKDIILKCLDGVPLQDNHPVLLVDCLPNRLLGTTCSNFCPICHAPTPQAEQVCRVVICLPWNAAGQAQLREQCSKPALHGHFLGWWHSYECENGWQCGRETDEFLVGSMWGGRKQTASPQQFRCTTPNAGSAYSLWWYLSDTNIQKVTLFFLFVA